ncbi:hypothetical protein ACEWPL_017370 [Roseovarius sp. S1116L3]|uniref:hypothetical protein n=1 Tax=Roseovarius roseus TaxID=3342636 RepID=UPI0037262BAD
MGDGAFKAKSENILRERLKESGAVFVSHSLEQMKQICSSGVVLQNGRFFYYARVERAIEHYQHTMKGRRPPWMR